MNEAFDENRYKSLIEKLDQSPMDVIKGRKMILKMVQQLEPYYQVLLSRAGMEAFHKISQFCEYIKMHITDEKIEDIQEYITLCNETGQIVGEEEDSELFSEYEILTMREAYFAEDQEKTEKDELICDYDYCIFESLYYMMGFYSLEDNKKEAPNISVKKIIEYILEETLLDFNEEWFSMTGASFSNKVVDLLLAEI